MTASFIHSISCVFTVTPQARLPDFRPNVRVRDMPESCEEWEELVWRPHQLLDDDIIMFLRAARSIAAYAGMCVGGSAEHGLTAASMDETTMKSLDAVSQQNIDISLKYRGFAEVFFAFFSCTAASTTQEQRCPN